MSALKHVLISLNKNINNEIIFLRSIFLRCIALIYLCSYLSTYFQIQGLFGDEGIYPAKNLMEVFQKSNKDKSSFSNLPTLLWYSDYIGGIFASIFPGFSHFSNTELTLYVLCIISIFISASIVANIQIFYNMTGFFLLWIIYLTFYITGQDFFNNQWDLFLLETGFLAFLFAPTNYTNLIRITIIDDISFHLLKFLLFRFVFSYGVVQFTSNDSSWQSFNVLMFYFQSQALPTMHSWISHNVLSDGFKRMLVAGVLTIQVKYNSK